MWSAMSISSLNGCSTPSALQEESRQQKINVMTKAISVPCISVTSRPVLRLNSSMAPMVNLQGYSLL